MSNITETTRLRLNSRKLCALFWGWFILLTMYDISLLTTSAHSLYSTFMGGIVTLYAIYCGANIGNHIWGKEKEITSTDAPPVPTPTACSTCGQALSDKETL